MISSCFSGVLLAFGLLIWYNRQERKTKGTHTRNLFISAADYDYHTLLKVAEMAGLAGIVGFHEAEDGYLLSFPKGEGSERLIEDYKSRLRNLENNIWMH